MSYDSRLVDGTWFIETDNDFEQIGATVNTSAATEQLKFQVSLDVSAVDAQKISITLTAPASPPNSVDGTFAVRIGGVAGGTDGDLAGELIIASGASTGTLSIPRLVLRGDPALIKVTLRSASGGTTVTFAGMTFGIGLIAVSPPTLTPNKLKGGNDIWMDSVGYDGAPDMNVTPAGDWRLVSGLEALQQSLIRRFVDALSPHVKGRARQSDIDYLTGILRERALRDQRVARVESVTVEKDENMTKFSVVIRPREDINQPVSVAGSLRV